MLDSLYENNGYEVPKRTAEDRSAWRESIRKKLTKTCCVQHTTEERQRQRVFIITVTVVCARLYIFGGYGLNVIDYLHRDHTVEFFWDTVR